MLRFCALMTVLAVSQAADYPSRPLGFVYMGGRSDAPIQWEAFIDINCPDCRTAYPVFTKVAEHYGPQSVALRIYNYPLPWHTNSFMGVAGAFVVNETTRGAKTFDWYRTVFETQAQFNVGNTTEKTGDEVLQMYAKIAMDLGVDHDSFWRGVTSERVHDMGETDWRFGAARAVDGTPEFFINGVKSDADETWTFEDWTKLFDQLLGVKTFEAPACKLGTKKCEYLPGKIECCTPGEGCIPNVGCRC